MLQLLLDTIPTRVFWKDRDSLYLGCNRLFAADAGYSSMDEIIGKSDYEMPWKEQADIYQADDRTVMSTGEPKLSYEEPLTMADGRNVQLRTNKVPLRNEEGQIIGVMGIYEDITDRKNAEEQLRDRESLYRTIFEHSPFSVALNNLSGKFVDVNERFTKIMGVPREEAIGRTPFELGIMDLSTQAAVLEAIGRTGASLDSYEFLARTRTGETKCALVSTALVNLKDEPLILSIINDITERREAEEALRRSEEKYRELVQSANSIILRWGRDGAVHFFNEFAQTFFGYTEEEILGRNVVGTIVPETETSGRDLQAMIVEITAHPEYHGTNVNENMRKNGERVWIAWTNKPVFDEQGEIAELLSVGLDITPRIRDQQALQGSEARYRSIFNSNVDAFLLFDTDGSIVDANARAGELYGYTRNELIGLCGKDIVNSGLHQMFEDFKDMALGEWFQRESTDTRRDGTKFDVEIHGAKLHYGANDRLLAIIFDVTERNKARETMQLFTNVVQNMQVGLYIYRMEDPSDDHTLRLMTANPASITGWGLDEGNIGKYIDEVFPYLREQGIPQRLSEVVRTGVPFDEADFVFSYMGSSHRHVSLRAFCLPDSQVGVLVENITNLIHAEEDKREFYRKTIEAATEGKLIICDPDEIEQMAVPSIATYEITRGEDLSMVRQVIAEIAKSEGMDDSRVFDLVLSSGEAATNAIKHAHGGKVSIHRHNGTLLIAVTDNGPGMQAINLPDVALKRGYTTAVSLGMGYKAMISIADHVYLATGPNGTTVAIEMELQTTAKSPAEIILPDTW